MVLTIILWIPTVYTKDSCRFNYESLKIFSINLRRYWEFLNLFYILRLLTRLSNIGFSSFSRISLLFMRDIHLSVLSNPPEAVQKNKIIDHILIDVTCILFKGYVCFFLFYVLTTTLICRYKNEMVSHFVEEEVASSVSFYPVNIKL